MKDLVSVVSGWVVLRRLAPSGVRDFSAGHPACPGRASCELDEAAVGEVAEVALDGASRTPKARLGFGHRQRTGGIQGVEQGRLRGVEALFERVWGEIGSKKNY